MATYVNPINPEHIKKYGRCTAMLINRLLYMQEHFAQKKMTRIVDGKHYSYHTMKSFTVELGYSERQIRRAVVRLRQEGLILTLKLSPDIRDHTLSYWIDAEKLGNSRLGHDVMIDPDMVSYSNRTSCPNPLYKKEGYNKKEKEPTVAHEEPFFTKVVREDGNEVWNTYCREFVKVYGAQPIHTPLAKSFAKKIQDALTKEIGCEVVEYYLGHGKNLYVKNRHDIKYCYFEMHILVPKMEDFKRRLNELENPKSEEQSLNTYPWG